jgi:hypothetical protein
MCNLKGCPSAGQFVWLMRSSGDRTIFEEHLNTPEARAVVKRPLSGDFLNLNS